MENLYKLFESSTGICTDTRKIQKDCLFLCLKGDNFNGNSFASKALLEGAKYVVVDEKEFANEKNIYLVDDVLIFLQKLANFHRNQFSIPIIGITGSNGKTSSKELINCVLSKQYNVLSTEGNLNNHIGVPLTILKINSTHEIAIIEMGANKLNDIKELCEIAEPNLAIITNIGKAHLEGFKNFEGVLKTKLELFNSIEEKKGFIIVNGDDDVLLENLPNTIQNIKYGQKVDLDIRGELVNLSPFVEMKWSTKNYTSDIVFTKMIGKYNFYNFLAAISFGIKFKVNPEKINEAISEYIPTNNRSQVNKTNKNTLILDCYNANPTSMQSALESFSLINHPKKIAIIGDMLELGEESILEHKNILNLTNKLSIKTITVGPLFFELNNSILKFSNTNDAIEYLSKTDFIDNMILLKGSRGIGLEKLEPFL